MRLMEADGQSRTSAPSEILRWGRRVVSAEDLRRSLNGHRELLLDRETVITPLAADELRAQGIRVLRQEALTSAAKSCERPWGAAQERPSPLVQSVLDALWREGLGLREIERRPGDRGWQWMRVAAECVARGDCRGGVLFCEDPGLACCIANKVPGIRAAAVSSIAGASRATLGLAANLVAVELSGRTFFEMRQIVRTVVRVTLPVCPEALAGTLQELDGHAHR